MPSDSRQGVGTTLAGCHSSACCAPSWHSAGVSPRFYELKCCDGTVKKQRGVSASTNTSSGLSAGAWPKSGLETIAHRRRRSLTGVWSLPLLLVPTPLTPLTVPTPPACRRCSTQKSRCVRIMLVENDHLSLTSPVSRAATEFSKNIRQRRCAGGLVCAVLFCSEANCYRS